jgi:hypothetical protein
MSCRTRSGRSAGHGVASALLEFSQLRARALASEKSMSQTDAGIA